MTICLKFLLSTFYTMILVNYGRVTGIYTQMNKVRVYKDPFPQVLFRTISETLDKNHLVTVLIIAYRLSHKIVYCLRISLKS